MKPGKAVSGSKAKLLRSAAFLALASGVAPAVFAQTMITINNGDSAEVRPDDGDTVNIAASNTSTLALGDMIFVDNADDVTINVVGTLISNDPDDDGTAIDVDINEARTLITVAATGRIE